jgi:hypothetical protein
MVVNTKDASETAINCAFRDYAYKRSLEPSYPNLDSRIDYFVSDLINGKIRNYLPRPPIHNANSILPNDLIKLPR